MKKILALALVLCLMFALVPVTTAETGSVYWLNFKPESDEVLQQIAKMYTEKTGVPVNVVTAAQGTYSQTLTAEMDKSTPPTLFFLSRAFWQFFLDYPSDGKILRHMQFFPVINPGRQGKVIAKSKAKEVKRKWHATALWFLKTRTSSATSSLRWLLP